MHWSRATLFPVSLVWTQAGLANCVARGLSAMQRCLACLMVQYKTMYNINRFKGQMISNENKALFYENVLVIFRGKVRYYLVKNKDRTISMIKGCETMECMDSSWADGGRKRLCPAVHQARHYTESFPARQTDRQTNFTYPNKAFPLWRPELGKRNVCIFLGMLLISHLRLYSTFTARRVSTSPRSFMVQYLQANSQCP